MPASDPAQFLPYLLNRAAESSSLQFAKTYKDRYGMARTDWRVMFHLGHYGDMTARDIGHRSGIHKTKISRAIARLQARRFLTREKDDRDRRFEHLSLTRNGRAAYDDLCMIAEEYEQKMIADLGADNLADLKRLLQLVTGTAASARR
jgi:DNA-binding MarR family transcriptional regulator